MPFDLSKHLVVGISSSALFDTSESHRVFMDRPIQDYVDYQIEKENEPFPKGAGFPLIEAMLRLNDRPRPHPVEVVVASVNEPAAGLRVMNSIEHYGLKMTRAFFTGGEPVSKYLKPFNVSLFLSKSSEDVSAALAAGVAAGEIYEPPTKLEIDETHLRIAFDGDAVIFGPESERIFKSDGGIRAFREHEERNALIPMKEGPFYPLLRLLSSIQSAAGEEKPIPVHIAIITARDCPAHKRVFYTLRAWGIQVKTLFFMGGVSKDEVLRAYRPHIFFDDQKEHVEPASQFVPSAEVRTVYDVPKSQLDLVVAEPVSKTGFEEGCRRIFRQYLPRGTTRLPQRQRDFIEKYKREELAEKRLVILKNLQKYDLQAGGHTFKIEFNRTSEDYLNEKLATLEREEMANDVIE